MTESDHDWIEYWTVFTDAGGIVQLNGYYSEWTARQFKRVKEQKLKAAGIHDAKLWIEHDRYDGMADPYHRKNMNGWELPPNSIAATNRRSRKGRPSERQES